MRGTSMADIGSYNEKLVLQMIRSAPGGMSQSQVVRGSGLSRQTVSLIARRLLQEGLIETAGQRISGPGKPSTTLQAVADSRWTIGLHVDPAYLTIVICDLQGNAVDTTILAAPSEDSAADIARIAAEIERLCTRHGAVKIHDAPASAPAPAPAPAPGAGTGTGADGADGRAALQDPPRRVVLGIGVAAPAPLDSASGVILDPPWLPSWHGVPVVAQLEAATGLPVLLDKDTNAALTGEIWAGHLPTEETILYLYLSHGVGSAVSANGRVHRGGSTQAGEIGHLPTGVADEICSCGRHGCLNLFAGARRMIERAIAAGMDICAEDVPASVDAIAAAAQRGESSALAAVERHLAAVIAALDILSRIHDPQRIIVGGPVLSALLPLAAPRIRAGTPDWLDRSGCTLHFSELGNAAGAIGAACLFLEEELSPGRG
ncbi:ROK family protein [uncultured Brachybacterium sp.]|uniref:ROK family transcriptional regulator n=1 Tax=uncultured Brachybacterium sp. TaxID=189680 RepID=UPI00263537FA|nr:ROK family protein [uncultured Brachybacterium sp.]